MIEKTPLIYVTCTVRPELVRVQGRLQGAETYPETVAIKVRGDDGSLTLEDSAVTDERGYFELERKPNASPNGMKIVAVASWNNLTGTASSKP